MYKLEARDFKQDEWAEVVSAMDETSLVQTWEFAQAKASGGGKLSPECVVVHDDEGLVAAAQAMVVEVPFLRGGLAWLNQAPMLRPDAGANATVRSLSLIREHWAGEKGYYMRIAPALADTGENRSLMLKAGYSPVSAAPSWASTELDLTVPVEQLRARLKQKWRNCLNQSERLGLTCRSGAGEELFDELIGDYEEMLRAKTYRASVTPALLSEMQGLLPPGRKMQVFAARNAEERLGSVLIATFGRTCIYLVGAINDRGRKLNASYYLLWQTVLRMKELGFERFDLGGLVPGVTPRGIAHFKEGLSGQPYARLGAYEVKGSALASAVVRLLMRAKKV